MKYTVDYFLKKFEEIPEENMIRWEQTDEEGRHCAYGWCMLPEKINLTVAGEGDGHTTEEGKSLTKLFNQLKNCTHMHWGTIGRKLSPALVNNGVILEYRQKTPKKRVLAALQDIKRIQAKEAKN